MSINLNKKMIVEQTISPPSSDQHSDDLKNSIEQNMTLSVLTSEDQIKQKELELINLSQPQQSVVEEPVPQSPLTLVYPREDQVQQVKYEVLPISIPQAVGKEPHLPSPDHIHAMGASNLQNLFNASLVSEQEFSEFDQELLDLLKPYNDTDCQYAAVGLGEDGVYISCKNFFNRSQALVNAGIDGHDTLGCQVSTEYSIPNYQYDCTNPHVPVCEGSGPYQFFSHACIGDNTEKTEAHVFYSLDDIIKRHNLTHKHITLKLDCEGCEWSAFKNFPLEDLEYIDQILIEMHFADVSPERWGNLEIIRSISKYFVNVNFHVPHWLCLPEPSKNFRKIPGRVIEATFVNRKLITLFSDSRSFALHPLNFHACNNTYYSKDVVKFMKVPIDLPDAVGEGLHTPSINHTHALDPTKGQKPFNSSLVSQLQLSSFDQEILDLLKPYHDTDCQLAAEGEDQDGPRIACNNFLKHSQALVNIGIHGNDALGCQISTGYSIPNYQYDCTNPDVTLCKRGFECVNPTMTVCKGGDPYQLFSYACLGEKTEKIRNNVFYTLKDIIRRHNLTQKHITLKIDCQGCEWSAFKYFPLEDLEYIDQILIEINFADISPERWGNLQIIRAISKQFVNVNFHVPQSLCNPGQSKIFRKLPGKAITATLVNRKLIKLKSNFRSFALHPLNDEACPNPPDTQGDEINSDNNLSKANRVLYSNERETKPVDSNIEILHK